MHATALVRAVGLALGLGLLGGASGHTLSAQQASTPLKPWTGPPRYLRELRYPGTTGKPMTGRIRYYVKMAEVDEKTNSGRMRWMDRAVGTPLMIAFIPAYKLDDFDTRPDSGKLFTEVFGAEDWRKTAEAAREPGPEIQVLRRFRDDLSMNRDKFAPSQRRTTFYTAVHVKPGMSLHFQQSLKRAVEAYKKVSPDMIINVAETIMPEPDGPDFVVMVPLKSNDEIDKWMDMQSAVEKAFGISGSDDLGQAGERGGVQHEDRTARQGDEGHLRAIGVRPSAFSFLAFSLQHVRRNATDIPHERCDERQCSSGDRAGADHPVPSTSGSSVARALLVWLAMFVSAAFPRRVGGRSALQESRCHYGLALAVVQLPALSRLVQARLLARSGFRDGLLVAARGGAATADRAVRVRISPFDRADYQTCSPSARLTDVLGSWGGGTNRCPRRSSGISVHARVHAMFFTVGWHYTKQAFGCMMVYASFDGYRFTIAQRNLVKWNLLEPLVAQFRGWQLGARCRLTFSDFRYYSFDLPVHRSCHSPRASCSRAASCSSPTRCSTRTTWHPAGPEPESSDPLRRHLCLVGALHPSAGVLPAPDAAVPLAPVSGGRLQARGLPVEDVISPRAEGDRLTLALIAAGWAAFEFLPNAPTLAPHLPDLADVLLLHGGHALHQHPPLFHRQRPLAVQGSRHQEVSASPEPVFAGTVAPHAKNTKSKGPGWPFAIEQ